MTLKISKHTEVEVFDFHTGLEVFAVGEANRRFRSFSFIKLFDYEGKEEGRYELSCSVLHDTDWQYVTHLVTRV